VKELLSLVGYLIVVFSIPALFVVFGHTVVKPRMEPEFATSTPPLAELVDAPRWSKNWCGYCEGQTIWTTDGMARCQTCGLEREASDYLPGE
jgi:hypothetical protein